jgi:4-hydroxybenzoate polyprenyltransferase
MTPAPEASPILRVLSLLTLARWYNILLIALAQYLTAIYALGLQPMEVLANLGFHTLVFCTALTVASGFIINHFYDVERDMIARPERTQFERLSGASLRLHAYLLFNTLSIGLAWLLSWRAAGFFFAYALALWFYSHKMKKVPVLSNASAAALSLVPFASIFLYYQTFPLQLLGFLLVIYFTEWARGMLKDLEFASADLITGRPTVPTVLGIQESKWAFTALTASAMALLGTQALFADKIWLQVAMMVGVAALAASIPTAWLSSHSKQYRWANRLLKGVILGGIASIPFLLS